MLYYESVFRKLNECQVRYVVAGGVAIVLHGVVRLTADLDIIVDFEQENIDRFARAMGDLGYRPKVPVKAEELGDPAKRENWVEQKGMQVFSFFHPQKQLELIDVFVKEIIPFAELYAEKSVVKAGDVSVPIVSIKHLKMLKEMAGRPQDLADVQSLNNLLDVEEEGS
ncbi:MAG: hypothetical protein P8123_08945 [bacterium]